MTAPKTLALWLAIGAGFLMWTGLWLLLEHAYETRPEVAVVLSGLPMALLVLAFVLYPNDPRRRVRMAISGWIFCSFLITGLWWFTIAWAYALALMAAWVLEWL